MTLVESLLLVHSEQTWIEPLRKRENDSRPAKGAMLGATGDTGVFTRFTALVLWLCICRGACVEY